MKRNYFNALILSFFFMVLVSMFSSCRSSKEATKTDDEVFITVPCSGSESKEYLSDSKTLRFSAIGESMDQMTAKKKAMSEGRAGLAAAINTLVKGVTDNYVKSGNFNNQEELLKKYEGLTREVINQSLSGVITTCEKMAKTKSGNYKSYVCVELGGNELLQSLNNRISNDQMLKVDYNYEKFRKIWEEEMKKFEK